ncbi:hypothetical protein [Roseomonas sp. HF4]|uniref:hypothetical protein n=1 Tax=Roseomonas sp. HF4 TaxID=2562313 RepID=UPI0010C0DB9D|nr:hypothetical protein [Roseomonas sp. HF4]
MPLPRPDIDFWPLLPRPVAEGDTRPEDEPARAAVTAAVGLAALFLVLRHAFDGSGLAREFALLVALVGCKGSLAIILGVFALTFGAALATPLGIPPMLRRLALGAFDHLLHLALVLSVAGSLGLLVLSGGVNGLSVLYAAFSLLLIACHRTRIWLTRHSAA